MGQCGGTLNYKISQESMGGTLEILSILGILGDTWSDQCLILRVLLHAKEVHQLRIRAVFSWRYRSN